MRRARWRGTGFGEIQMLIVYAVVSAAVAACLFVALYEVGHREVMPVWADKYGGFEFVIPVIIAGIVFSFLFPILFVLDFAHSSFGVADAIVSLAVAVIGIFGVTIQIARMRKRAASVVPLSATDIAGGDAGIVAPPSNENAPRHDPRPQRPTGTSGRRARKAA